MIEAIALFLLNTGYVWLKAFQNLNIIHDKYWWIPPVSLAMGYCEVFTISTIAATQKYWFFIPMGLGGAAGAILAMLTHKYFRERKREA